MDTLKIVDAHQHFWDLAHNYYPWLCDEPPIADQERLFYHNAARIYRL